MTVDEEKLSRIEAKWAAAISATSPSWGFDGDDICSHWHDDDGPSGPVAYDVAKGAQRALGDAPEDVTALLAEVRRLRAPKVTRWSTEIPKEDGHYFARMRGFKGAHLVEFRLDMRPDGGARCYHPGCEFGDDAEKFDLWSERVPEPELPKDGP